MLSKTSLLVAAGIFLGLSLGFAGYCASFAREAEASLGFFTEKLARLDASAQQTQDRIAARQRDAAAFQATLASEGAAAAANHPAGDPDPLTALASNPKLRDLYLSFFRSYTARRFGWMYPILGFSPAQIDKFEELRTGYEGDKIDLRTAALALGLDPSDPIAAAPQKYEEYQSALDALEGPVAKQKLDQFYRMEQQPWIATMDSMIPVGSEPFTGAQIGQLHAILADASPSYQKGGNADPNDIDWDNASAQAATLLSGPQLQVFNATAQLAQVSRLIKQFYSQSHNPTLR